MKPDPRKVLMFDENFESMYDLKKHIEDDLGWIVILSAEPKVLDRLRTERFDLVMIDVMIHEKSFDEDDNEVDNIIFEGVNWKRTGLEFLRRLRRGDYVGKGGEGTPADVPVIVLSAVADYSTKLDPNLKISAYATKPFYVDVITEKIQQLLKE